MRYRLLTASLVFLVLSAHRQSEHAKKLIAALGDLMDGRPDAMRLVLISAKQ